MIADRITTKNGNYVELTEFNPDGTKTILIIGVVHGEEQQGKYLIEKYLKNNTEFKNHMIFIPCLNPDGMLINKRQNANGVDLNRNFPTENWGEDCRRENAEEYFGGNAPASEIETQFVIKIMEKYHPDIILTIHAPYKVVNYDGPAENIAKAISKIIGYPTSNDIGYPTPGSFGNYAGVERNIPIITLELDEEKTIGELSKPVFKIFDLLSSWI